MAYKASDLQIDLQRHSLGVGEIFLHGWIGLETAVPHAVGRFCSIPRSQGEKMGFVLKRRWFRALRAASKNE